MEYSFYKDHVAGKQVRILTGIYTGETGRIIRRVGSNNTSIAKVQHSGIIRDYHCKNLQLC